MERSEQQTSIGRLLQQGNRHLPLDFVEGDLISWRALWSLGILLPGDVRRKLPVAGLL